MESLEKRWEHLRLTSDENNEIVVEDEILLKGIKKGKNSIIGKLHVDLSIGKDIIRNTMMKIWKTSKLFSVFGVGSNACIFSFGTEEDMQWVMTERHGCLNLHCSL